MSHPSPLLKDRSPQCHPAFNLFRDMDELEKHVNETIVLPVLGHQRHKNLLPAEDDSDHYLPILLTRQRVDIIKRFFEDLEIAKDDVRIMGKSLILSGPFVNPLIPRVYSIR